MSVTALNEQALLERASRLDESALAEVHQRYYGEIYRYVLYRTSRTEVADDLASETFVRFLDSLHAGRPPRTTLRGWLFGVANNLVADHFRTAPRESEALDEALADPASPSAEAEHRLALAQVRAALPSLTRDQQEAISLRFGNGFSVEETAQAMGKTPNAIRVLQFRAVEALKRALQLGAEASRS